MPCSWCLNLSLASGGWPCPHPWLLILKLRCAWSQHNKLPGLKCQKAIQSFIIHLWETDLSQAVSSRVSHVAVGRRWLGFAHSHASQFLLAVDSIYLRIASPWVLRFLIACVLDSRSKHPKTRSLIEAI